LYIPPYRHDIPGPYDDAQYAKFKMDVKTLAAKYGANFEDLDNTVPGSLWATVVDINLGFEEPDFMHFTAEGHRRLANAMKDCLVELGF
jgi:lysophospholipase L1-like esterase